MVLFLIAATQNEQANKTNELRNCSIININLQLVPIWKKKMIWKISLQMLIDHFSLIDWAFNLK